MHKNLILCAKFRKTLNILHYDNTFTNFLAITTFICLVYFQKCKKNRMVNKYKNVV